MSDRATIVTANILEAIAAPLRQRAQEAFERGVPENLLGLMHEELAGLEGEWELLGEAAQRVVDRIADSERGG